MNNTFKKSIKTDRAKCYLRSKSGTIMSEYKQISPYKMARIARRAAENGTGRFFFKIDNNDTVFSWQPMNKKITTTLSQAFIIDNFVYLSYYNNAPKRFKFSDCYDSAQFLRKNGYTELVELFSTKPLTKEIDLSKKFPEYFI